MIFFVVMHLPDPTPSSDGHYKPLAEILGRRLQKTIYYPFRRSRGKKTTLPFQGVLQHVKNANMMLECEDVECGAYFL